MKVAWLVRVPIGERDGQLYSPLAGVRMRTIVPMLELKRRGHAASIVQLPDTGVPAAAALAALEASDAVFFGPVLPAPGQSIDDAAAGVFALLEHLRARGITALADIHDDHFEVPGRIQYFTGLVRKAALLRAMPVLDNIPSTDVRGTRVLIIAGAADETYGPFAPALVTLLTKRGAEVDARIVASGHDIGDPDAAIVRQWLAAPIAA